MDFPEWLCGSRAEHFLTLNWSFRAEKKMVLLGTEADCSSSSAKAVVEGPCHKGTHPSLARGGGRLFQFSTLFQGNPPRKVQVNMGGRLERAHRQGVCTSKVGFASMENTPVTVTCLCGSYSSKSQHILLWRGIKNVVILRMNKLKYFCNILY